MSTKETFFGEIGKKIPIDKVYDDVLHPVLSEVGTTLQGTVKMILTPLNAMIWGYDRIAKYLEEELLKYFQNRKIPKEKVISPNPAIAVPTIEALRCVNREYIKEMFVNILGASMNVDTAELIHPSFVNIIWQLTPDEAKILKYLPQKGLCEPLINIEVEKVGIEGRFVVHENYGVLGYEADCEYPERISLYIDNLQRLALVKVPENNFLADEWRYDKIINSEQYNVLLKKVEQEGKAYCIKKMVGLTEYGMLLKEICLE